MRRDWLASIGCLIVGHDDLVRRSSSRMFLECERCGRETSGWTIGSPAATLVRRARFSPITRLGARLNTSADRDQKVRCLNLAHVDMSPSTLRGSGCKVLA